MAIRKFDLDEISGKFDAAWAPVEVEAIGGSVLRAAKFEGEYRWHKHDDSDEMFIVYRGKIKVQTRKGDFILERGQGIKVPMGMEHRPVALVSSIVLMFEPLTLKSNGD